jgi:hypothetical protein
MQQHNIAKHMYGEVNRKPNPDLRQEKTLEVSSGVALGFFSHMVDNS